MFMHDVQEREALEKVMAEAGQSTHPVFGNQTSSFARQNKSADARLDCGQTQSVNGEAPARPGIAEVDQLRQLTTATWDGSLISKAARDRLFKAGLVARAFGWNFLTEKGVEVCLALGILRS